MNRPQRIGFIGLRMMGSPLGECLSKAGYELFVADADLNRVTGISGRSGMICLTSLGRCFNIGFLHGFKG
ncbi:NAD(P)-binding domain-containing protein [Caballeronia sordidicola]|uniref:6-phosphogluconate dehydrogenase NADP-binding domain-containing protein n=1 Tax=Caballeronia sordidicola TaxID=196367 RepID=A0A242MPH4_CABSO|nr:hypothetical protein PAMC26510_20030 [Caballeronia sordidicola]